MSTYTFMIGVSKGEIEKAIRLIFDKSSKEATVVIRRIEIRGVEDSNITLGNVECDECPRVSSSRVLHVYRAMLVERLGQKSASPAQLGPPPINRGQNA